MLKTVKKINQNTIILVLSTKEVYNSLRAKYYDYRLAIVSSKLKELINYKKKNKESIQNIQIRLSKLRSNIITIKLSIKESYNNTKFLIRLLNYLLSLYNIIVNIFKARNNIATLEALWIL